MALDASNSKKGKLRLAIVHPQMLNSLARVAEISEKKGYVRLNWVRPDVKCFFVDYLLSACLRHIEAFLSGEDVNIEKTQDGEEITEPHVLHVESAAYNLLMIAALFRQGRTDLDDRGKLNG